MADNQSFTNRLHVPLPKIGIRPAIDGRYGGVRESLEELTLSMAHEAAKLITSNLRHSNGAPVECVVPDHCIGGFPEAADVDQLFAKNDVGATLTVTPCWCYGLETLDMHPTRPKAIWGFNGTDRPGAVYLAAALSAHAQKGIPAFGIYGHDVQDLGDSDIPGDIEVKLLRFARAAIAAATLPGTSYLAIGGVSMGIAGSAVDQDLFQEYFGMRVESVDMAEVAGRINKKIYDEAEYETALAWVREHCLEGNDINPTPRSREEKDADWETNVKMALIFRDLMVGNPKLAEKGFIEASRGHNALASGFQGQRNWTDYFPNGDFPEAILNSSFDWNGLRQPYIVATENDSLNGISMLLGHLLTGTAQLFSDVRTYWSPTALARVTSELAAEDKILPASASNGVLHLINSGPSALDWTGEAQQNGNAAVKPFWEMSDSEADACLEATKWCASDLGYFPAGGWSTDFTTHGGIPCTMFRINLAKGLGPVLQIAEGETVALPPKVHDILDSRTSPTWPTTWFAPRLTGEGAFESTYEVMRHWGANHGAIAPGHIGADLISLASILRIPVEMHNVSKSGIFRPASWDRFGSEDSEAADFRACAAYGPLYG